MNIELFYTFTILQPALIKKREITLHAISPLHEVFVHLTY